jgi:hypothetical protein
MDSNTSKNERKSKKKSRDEDEESVGSLKDFIVDDEEIDEASVSSDEESDEESDISMTDSEESEGSATEEPTSEVVTEETPKKKPRRDEDPELIKLLAEEAHAFVKGNLEGTVVGGRTLRSRDPVKIEQRKPKDMYYERFGRYEEERAMEKFDKRDIIEFLKKLAPEHKEAYEAAGKTWPSFSARDSKKLTLEYIRQEYANVKKFIGLPDSDDETSDAEVDEDDDEELEDDDDDMDEE